MTNQKINMHFSLISAFHDLDKGLKGNISAVVFCEKFPDAQNMQSIANDFNQPATTFLSPAENGFNIRWFAPDAEIDLCGHGSHAAVKYLFDAAMIKTSAVFFAKKDIINVKIEGKDEFSIQLDEIPVKEETEIPELLEQGLGVKIQSFHTGAGKEIVLLESEKAVKSMKPDFATLRKLDYFGYAVTASGENTDFVSRTLVPHVAQLEDHATGSSHAVLVPFWAKKLSKNTFTAHQLSPRGGAFKCLYKNQKVTLTGKCKTLAKGTL